MGVEGAGKFALSGKCGNKSQDWKMWEKTFV